MNAGPIEPDVVELELMPLLAGRSNVHGTATCLPELDEFEPSEAEAVELVLEVELPVAEVPDVPELFSEMIAKSTFPAAELMTTSWIVPNVSPEEDCRLELLSLLAWIS